MKANEERKERINKMLEIIKKHKKIDVDKLLVLASYELGVTKKKADEYLFVLYTLGKVDVKDNVVYYKG